ncbi:tetratricopeptide repeat protein [Pedobacter steynii]
MKTRCLGCCLWLLFVPLLGFTQQHVLDSLKKDIQKKQRPDTSRVKALVAYVVEALNNNSADFLPYMNEVLSISKKINYRPGLQKGYMIGQIYFSDRGDYQKGFLYADSAFSVLKNDTALSARQNTGHLYSNIAGDYDKIGDYEKASENYTASVRIFEPMGHPFLSAVYGGLALVYEKLNETSKAIEYDKKAIAVAKKAGTPVHWLCAC